MKTRYFTKSLFKLAYECPTKLYYFNKPEYKNDQEEDAFLEALKAGGYQVGALAKAYHEGGVDLQDYNNDQAFQKTQELLKQDKVIIFEALFRHENMQIRCDILIKDSDKIEIIEVKSSSYSDKDSKYRDQSGNVISEFRNKKGGIIPDWKEYLLDVAFQYYVVSKVLPQFRISYFLSLVDKDQICPVDGLNQKFIINRDSDGKIKIISKGLTEEEKKPSLLRKINVESHIHELMAKDYEITTSVSFQAYVEHLASEYVADRKIATDIGDKCHKCQFNYSFHKEPNNFKSGIRECWKGALKWEDKDFESTTVLDIWNFRDKQKLIKQEKKIKLEEILKEHIDPEEDDLDGLSQKQRQWRQIEMYQAKCAEPYIHPKLKEVMAKWVFPLHFIDFETCTVAIPFHKGQKPYEPLAFQFSHHIVQRDGTIEHRGEYIDTRPGVFPNYDFARALKTELEQDNGTIFRYHNHENTILNAIYQQLKADKNKPADSEALCTFIKSITKSTDKSSEKWVGPRNMVDLEEVIRKYTYLPATNGRTTMKLLFPTVLNLSSTLQQKYAQPIYGAATGIKSRNFKDWSIVEKGSDNEITSPYKRLQDVFEDEDQVNAQLLERAERIDEGGMASTAYALMQFSEVSDKEREALKNALLRYCELDTLAMVIVYEYLSLIKDK